MRNVAEIVQRDAQEANDVLEEVIKTMVLTKTTGTETSHKSKSIGRKCNTGSQHNHVFFKLPSDTTIGTETNQSQLGPQLRTQKQPRVDGKGRDSFAPSWLQVRTLIEALHSTFYMVQSMRRPNYTLFTTSLRSLADPGIQVPCYSLSPSLSTANFYRSFQGRLFLHPNNATACEIH